MGVLRRRAARAAAARVGELQLLSPSTGRNQSVTDNINIGPANYIGPYCVPVPTDPRLPKGGGWQLCDIYQLAPAAFSIPTQNVQTFTKTHLENANSSLKRITYNHGYDLTVNARTAVRDDIQGGINADRSINDTAIRRCSPARRTSQVNPITGEQYLPRRDAIPAGREAHRRAVAAVVGPAAVGHLSARLRARCVWRPGRSRRPARTRTGGLITTAPGSTAGSDRRGDDQLQPAADRAAVRGTG